MTEYLKPFLDFFHKRISIIDAYESEDTCPERMHFSYLLHRGKGYDVLISYFVSPIFDWSRKGVGRMPLSEMCLEVTHFQESAVPHIMYLYGEVNYSRLYSDENHFVQRWKTGFAQCNDAWSSADISELTSKGDRGNLERFFVEFFTKEKIADNLSASPIAMGDFVGEEQEILNRNTDLREHIYNNAGEESYCWDSVPFPPTASV